MLLRSDSARRMPCFGGSPGFLLQRKFGLEAVESDVACLNFGMLRVEKEEPLPWQ